MKRDLEGESCLGSETGFLDGDRDDDSTAEEEAENSEEEGVVLVEVGRKDVLERDEAVGAAKEWDLW